MYWYLSPLQVIVNVSPEGFVFPLSMVPIVPPNPVSHTAKSSSSVCVNDAAVDAPYLTLRI